LLGCDQLATGDIMEWNEVNVMMLKCILYVTVLNVRRCQCAVVAADRWLQFSTRRTTSKNSIDTSSMMLFFVDLCSSVLFHQSAVMFPVYMCF